MQHNFDISDVKVRGFVLTHYVCMFVCLQAVETNLASKDSHWVFVNEVGLDTAPVRLDCSLNKHEISFSIQE